MNSIWVSGRSKIQEEAAVVQFWPGSELDCRGPKVQTWQHCRATEKISFLRRISMAREGTSLSSSPLNSLMLSFTRSRHFLSLFLLSSCPLKSFFLSLFLLSLSLWFPGATHSLQLKTLLAHKVNKTTKCFWFSALNRSFTPFSHYHLFIFFLLVFTYLTFTWTQPNLSITV